jgi:hypothetical protein
MKPTPAHPIGSNPIFGTLTSTSLLAGMIACLAFANTNAQPITVPNGSFELQSGEGQQFGVNILVDSWQKPEQPAYFDAVETNFGIFWIQTAGVFLDTITPYGNLDQLQAGYMLPFPQVALFQDYETVDWNDGGVPSNEFNAIYQPGMSYNLTVGVFGKGMAEGSSNLRLSLYYRDGANMVDVGFTDISFSTNTFVNVGSLDLIDFDVTVPTVLAGDPWAGENIGIKLEVLFGDGAGNWDFDNVRLTAVPEPASIALLALGAGALLWTGRTKLRRRRN